MAHFGGSAKNKLPYVKSLFPNEAVGKHGPLKEGENYDEETLNYITPYPKAQVMSTIISDTMGATIIVDACAGIGGSTLGFVLSPKVKKVLAYEVDRKRWTMLVNNMAQYDTLDKSRVYNQEFAIGEDLRLLDLTVEYPEKDTVIFFDPPWLPAGMSIDKNNYILSGIRVSDLTLEEWCTTMCHIHGIRGIVMHLPRDYKLALPGQIIDDISSKKARIIYYTIIPEVASSIEKNLSIVRKEEPVIELKRDIVPSYETGLDEIPSMAKVQGPKVILQVFLTPNFPRRKYFKETFNPKAIHLGQRKLLMSEIEFLTRVLKNRQDEYTLLYVGAAPGQHIPMLSEMFPEVTFILYDPAPFKIKPTANIQIHQELFTDDEVKKYSETKNLLFVSDIRSAPKPGYAKDPDKEDPEFEEEVRKNLMQQKAWVTSLKPTRSLLKFRLPFTSPEEKSATEYFDGIVFFQAYAPPQSTETRLEVGPNAKLIMFDHTVYEQQMFYFNTKYRVQNFSHYERRYGWSYDTIREYFILLKYLAFRGRGNKDIPKYFEQADTLSDKPFKKISKILAKY